MGGTWLSPKHGGWFRSNFRSRTVFKIKGTFYVYRPLFTKSIVETQKMSLTSVLKPNVSILLRSILSFELIRKLVCESDQH